MTKEQAIINIAYELTETKLVYMCDKEETDKYDLELLEAIMKATVTGHRYYRAIASSVYSCLQYPSTDEVIRDKLLLKYKSIFKHMDIN